MSFVYSFICTKFFFSDINSLYTKAAIDYQYPIGKYKIEIGSDLERNIEVHQNEIFFKGKKIICGSAHVRILPPQNLKFPFLQYRVNDLHVFLSLCKKCALTKTKKCNHDQSLRAFESCWLISDLNKALSLGYEIIKWFELHHYEKTDFILKYYSKILYALKLQNSGFPPGVNTYDQKVQYCQNINEAMQFSDEFKLDLNNVCLNEGQKNFFKSMLNNFYGKFSQNSNYTQTNFVNSHNQLMNLFQNNDVVGIYNINEFNLQVEFRPTKIPTNKQSCIYVGGQITSYARIIVYDYIMDLVNQGARIYSVINDAIFYSLPENVLDPLPFSNVCGHFKPVVDPSKTIISYFSLGNCNYSFLTQNNDGSLEQTIKVKGLTLSNFSNKNSITTDMFENFIDEHFSQNMRNILVKQQKIRVDKETKQFQLKFQNFTFDNDPHLKRFIPNINLTIETYPYGFLLPNIAFCKKRKLSESKNIGEAYKKMKFL